MDDPECSYLLLLLILSITGRSVFYQSSTMFCFGLMHVETRKVIPLKHRCSAVFAFCRNHFFFLFLIEIFSLHRKNSWRNCLIKSISCCYCFFHYTEFLIITIQSSFFQLFYYCHFECDSKEDKIYQKWKLLFANIQSNRINHLHLLLDRQSHKMYQTKALTDMYCNFTFISCSSWEKYTSGYC